MMLRDVQRRITSVGRFPSVVNFLCVDSSFVDADECGAMME
jgi:hypothetical protein